MALVADRRRVARRVVDLVAEGRESLRARLADDAVGRAVRYALRDRDDQFQVLLDKQDPSKVLARSREPLVRPDMTEREGYVPNVVYTCGALRHGERIILPYAVSDTFYNFATIKTSALLRALVG